MEIPAVNLADTPAGTPAVPQPGGPGGRRRITIPTTIHFRQCFLSFVMIVFKFEAVYCVWKLDLGRGRLWSNRAPAMPPAALL